MNRPEPALRRFIRRWVDRFRPNLTELMEENKRLQFEVATLKTRTRYFQKVAAREFTEWRKVYREREKLRPLDPLLREMTCQRNELARALLERKREDARVSLEWDVIEAAQKAIQGVSTLVARQCDEEECIFIDPYEMP